MARSNALQPPRSLRARIRRFLVDGALITRGDRVLAGVSGGPDSTCLLLVLASLRRSLRFELHAAYFDHGLRSQRAAAREQRFVRESAEALAVEFHTGAGDVRAHAKGRSLEDAARELRYRFLARTARDAGCALVAVGHTKDDQAETVLLHLIRGSGLRGLAAMPPEAAWPVAPRKDGPRLVRPLLCLSRAETERVCEEADVAPLRDPSNSSRTFLRNRVRSELLPLLRRYNPRIDDALVRFTDAASADVELIERLARVALEGESSSDSDNAVRLSRKRLAALPDALQRHAVRLAVARALGSAAGLSERHVRALLRANDGPTGAELDLPRRLRARVARDDIVLTTAARTPASLPDGEVLLAIPGTACFGGWRFEATVLPERPPDLRRDDPHVALLDAVACGDALSVRRRQLGDRFRPLGMAHPKKLQDFFVDAHVPRFERDATPLVCAAQGVAWVVGQRPAEWAKVTENNGAIVRVRAVPPA
ncbi:MAG: tRNA lysidine(34) synthetase TilS [Conexibacter sp.]